MLDKMLKHPFATVFIVGAVSAGVREVIMAVKFKNK